MTSREWRDRRMNRRCRFCRHFEYIPQGVYDWCWAKHKAINEDFPRWFCALYEQKEKR